MRLTDPRGFLSNYPNGAILDEIQNTPELFSYIQGLVDGDRQIHFILTGSSNFLLMEKISQTLAGRTAVLNLLPFSLKELEPLDVPYEILIFKGQYPRIYDREIPPTDFYPSYIQTYVDRDVRLDKKYRGHRTPLSYSHSYALDVSGNRSTMPAWQAIPESVQTQPNPGSPFWKVPSSCIVCNLTIAISISAW